MVPIPAKKIKKKNIALEKSFMLYMYVGCSLIAQSVEQVAVNHWVGGSSPSQGAIFLCLVMEILWIHRQKNRKWAFGLFFRLS